MTSKTKTPTDLQQFITLMTERGFTLEGDPQNALPGASKVSPRAALRRRHVLAWMPESTTITDAKTYGDFPI